MPQARWKATRMVRLRLERKGMVDFVVTSAVVEWLLPGVQYACVTYTRHQPVRVL